MHKKTAGNFREVGYSEIFVQSKFTQIGSRKCPIAHTTFGEVSSKDEMCRDERSEGIQKASSGHIVNY